MCTAVNGMDIVGEGAEGFAVEIGIVLERYFNGNIINNAVQINYVGVENLRTAHFLKPFNIAYDTALVSEAFALYVVLVTGIGDIDKDTAV